MNDNMWMQARVLLGSLVMVTATVSMAAPEVGSGDGAEISDTATGLIWRRCAEGASWTGSSCVGEPLKMRFDVAKERARSEALASGLRWRLPTERELASIAPSGDSPTSDPAVFPVTPAGKFWTCTPKKLHGECGVEATGSAYVRRKTVVFANEGAYARYRLESNHVRLVRGSK